MWLVQRKIDLDGQDSGRAEVKDNTDWIKCCFLYEQMDNPGRLILARKQQKPTHIHC